MIVIAYRTFRRDISIKRKELIDKIYGRFLEEDLYEFYIRVCRQDPVDLQPGRKDEQLLNKSLTLFDEVNYFMTQKLLDKNAWEYIATEIQNFSRNEKIWDYMCKFMKEYNNKGFPEEIIPFTGFPELVKKVPPKFRANPFPRVPDQYKALQKKEAVHTMNIPRRLVLIIGGIAFLVIWTIPIRVAQAPDLSTAITRSIGIIGATLLVFFASKKNKE